LEKHTVKLLNRFEVLIQYKCGYALKLWSLTFTALKSSSKLKFDFFAIIPDVAGHINSSVKFSNPSTLQQTGSSVGLNKFSFCFAKRWSKTFSKLIDFLSIWISGLTPWHSMGKTIGSGLSLIQQTISSWTSPVTFENIVLLRNVLIT
jgi:hypothetical protein